MSNSSCGEDARRDRGSFIVVERRTRAAHALKLARSERPSERHCTLNVGASPPPQNVGGQAGRGAL